MEPKNENQQAKEPASDKPQVGNPPAKNDPPQSPAVVKRATSTAAKPKPQPRAVTAAPKTAPKPAQSVKDPEPEPDKPATGDPEPAKGGVIDEVFKTWGWD